MRRGVVLVVLGVGLLGVPEAHAQHEPIQEGDVFSLDLYTGAALGSVRIVGMGGTALAASEGTAGTIVNPAFAAVRRTTSQGTWDWDFHFDYLEGAPGRGLDFDNSGVTEDGSGNTLFTGGLAGMLEGWGLAVVGTSVSAPVGDLEASALSTKFAIAKELLRQTWTVGAAIRIGSFEIADDALPLFRLTGAGLELGALWRPPDDDWRVGAAVSFPISGATVEDACDEPACAMYELPATVEVPWQVTAGVAWRWAPTRWNQQMTQLYRDEPAILLAADVVITGAVDSGYGLEAYGRQQLQPSGRHTIVSLRGGAEYEWLPGRLRVRGGSYWEPGRFEDVDGRLHGTLGVEVALFQMRFWRWTYRPRLSATGDVATQYVNFGLSIGFWH